MKQKDRRMRARLSPTHVKLAAALVFAALAVAGCATAPAAAVGCSAQSVLVADPAGGPLRFRTDACPVERYVRSASIRATYVRQSEPRSFERIIRDGDLASLTALSLAMAGDERLVLWRLAPTLDALAANEPARARADFDASKPQEAPRTDVILAQAFVAAAEGDVDRGVFTIEDAWNGDPEPRARALALLHELAGRPEEALRLYDALAKDAPPPPPRDADAEPSPELIAARLRAWRSAELWRRRAAIEQRDGRWVAAKASWERVFAFAPRDPEALAGLAGVSRRAPPDRPPLTASTALARALSDFADAQATEIIVRGGVTGDIAGARRIEFVPQMFRAYAAALDPKAEDLALQAASGFAALGELETALRALDRIAKSGPGAAFAAIERANLLLDLDRPAEARAALAPLGSQAGHPSADLALALLYMRLGEDASAMAAISAADAGLSQADDRIDALRVRASVSDFFDRPDASLAAMRAALALGPTRRDVRSMLAGVLGEHPDRARRAEGAELWRKLVAEREDADSLNGLAWTLLQDPTPEALREAHLLAMRAAAAAPQSPAIVDTLGWSFYLHGDFYAARRELARAVELAKEDPIAEIHDHLGDTLWRLDRKDEARAAWREGLAAHPDVARRRALEAKIKDGLTSPAPPRRTPPEAGVVGPRAPTGPLTQT